MNTDEATSIVIDVATKRRPHSRQRVREAVNVLEPMVQPELGPKEKARLAARVETEEAKAAQLADTAREAAEQAAAAAEKASAAAAAQGELVASMKASAASAGSAQPTDKE